MKNFYLSDSYPSSKALPEKNKRVTLLFAMIGVTALGACSQSPAPIFEGNQVLNSPGSTLFETASMPFSPVTAQAVEVTEIEPLPTSRQRDPDWLETADIGSNNRTQHLSSPPEVDVPINRQPKLVQSRAQISENTRATARTAMREEMTRQPLSQTVAVPRFKPQAPEQVAMVVPRSRPSEKTPESVENTEASTPIQMPVKTKIAESTQATPSQAFVDIPIGQKQVEAQAQPEEQVAMNRPTSNPDIVASKFGKVTFSWPVTGPVITRFGPTEDGKRNEGINIAVREGARVRSAEAGVVAYVGNELTGYGNLLLVRHESGYVTAYAHNKKLLVKKGDSVKKGDVIALAGMSGSVDEPQLHFEVRKGVNAVDPMKYLGRPGARG